MKEHAAKAMKQAAYINQSQGKGGTPPPYPSTMMSRERQIRENYEFLKKHIHDAPVTPMMPSIWEGVLAKIDASLTGVPNAAELLQQTKEELEQDYDKNLRKFMVAQVLKKPNVRGVSQETIPKDEIGLDFSSPWRPEFLSAHSQITTNLNIVHPTMQSVLALCEKLSTMLLVDLSDLKTKGAIDCENLRNTAIVECEKSEDKVMNTWFPEVASVFYDNKTLASIKNTVSFYESVDTLISVNLKTLIRHSFNSWIELFDDIHTTPVFKLQLVLDEDQMQFYPSLEELQDAIVSVVHIIADSLQKVPKMHGWITVGEAAGYVSVATEKALLDRNIKHLIERFQRNLDEPKQELESYSKYRFLINGEAEASVKSFIDSEHSLEDYIQEIEKFKLLYSELSGLTSSVYFNMIELNCRDLRDGLVKRAQDFADHLLSHLAQIHRTTNERIQLEYEAVKIRALTEPADSLEIMDLIDYMEKAKKELIPSLMAQVEESHSRLLYLLEVFTFRMEEVELNKAVLMWPKQIPPIFDENEMIILKAKDRGEQVLKRRRENVILDLEKCARRVDEFAEYADPESMFQYCKDVQQVQKRLLDIQDHIAAVNKEEELFNAEISTFSELGQIQLRVEPYQKLFTISLKWQRSEKKWMDGGFLDLDAEQIDAEVDEFWREFFKVYKIFQQQQKAKEKERGPKSVRRSIAAGAEEEDGSSLAAMRICNTVQNQIKEFKTYLPIISTLCNPGIRPRHWQKMSEIIGFDITPDMGTSLRKVLKYDLSSHMEEFEAISAGASKEFSLEKAMHKMEEDWESIQFNTTSYRDTGVSILSAVDEIQTTLDDQIVRTQTMRGSPFIKPFEAQIKAWEERLLGMQETIDEWLKVQAQWLYLEPIFSSEDIMQQMPEEGRLFQQVDKHWKEVMKHTVKDPKVRNIVKQNIWYICTTLLSGSQGSFYARPSSETS
jgi:dynein heavy chain